MSIFNNETKDIIKHSNDLIDSFYELKYEWYRGKQYKQKICWKPKSPQEGDISVEYKKTYYYPNWVFIDSLEHAMSRLRWQAKNLNKRVKVDIKLSKLEVSNIRFRFNKLIEDLTKFNYKGDTLIYIDYSLRENDIMMQIDNMMYDYIKKETANIKYFLREK